MDYYYKQSAKKMISQNRKKMLDILPVLLFVFGAIPMATVTASNSTLVATVSANDANHALKATSYLAILWKYPESGAPSGVTSATFSAGKSVILNDPAASAASTHYSVQVIAKLKHGAEMQLANYHWGTDLSPVTNLAITVVSSGVQINANGQAVPYQVNQPASANKGNTTAPPTATPNVAAPMTWPFSALGSWNTSAPAKPGAAAPQTGCFLGQCWYKIQSWGNLLTTLGEGTGAGYMNDLFTYGVNSGSTVSTVVSSGGPFSASGSVTEYNTGQYGVQWALLYCCQNYNARSGFAYEEDQYWWCFSGVCHPTSTYQIYTTGYNGGNSPWTYGSSSQPGSCLNYNTQVNGKYSGGGYQPNTHAWFYAANGYSYTYALTISSGIVGGQGSATISDKTYYNSYTSQYFTFQSYYSQYYLYTNGLYNNPSNWPVVFSTTSSGSCY